MIFGAGTNELVAQQIPASGARAFFQADERGSVIAYSDSSGSLAYGPTAYDEYGIHSGFSPTPFGYTGQRFLGTTGLYYYKARMYSATLGRFMQTDPIGYADGPNWYNYVVSDPINWVDPSGLEQNDITVNGTTYIEGSVGGIGGGTGSGSALGSDSATRTAVATSPAPEIVLTGTLEQDYRRSGVKLTTGTSDGLGETAVAQEVSQEILVMGTIPKILQQMAKKSLKTAIKTSINSIDDVLQNPRLLTGMTPPQVAKKLGNNSGWRQENLRHGTKKGLGWVYREYTAAGNPTGRMIRYHPGGGHHGPDPYWRVTGSGHGDLIIPGGKM